MGSVRRPVRGSFPPQRELGAPKEVARMQNMQRENWAVKELRMEAGGPQKWSIERMGSQPRIWEAGMQNMNR